jgi:exopolysaccharide production protein ExoZ
MMRPAPPGAASRPRLSGIEAGRGLAAAAVVLYHAARHLDKTRGTPWLMHLFQFGHAGVDFFFVISGFIILFVHHADIGRPARLGTYVRRRVTRLVPAYWVALAVTIALAMLGVHHFPPAWEVIRSALLLPSDREPLLGIAWTLQHEVVFYALFCVLILHRAAGIAVFALWGLLIVLAAAGGHAPGGLPAPIAGLYNGEFFLGMAAAMILLKSPVLRPWLLLAAGGALFAGAAVAEGAGALNGQSDMARLCYGLPSILLVIGAGALTGAGRRAAPDWLVALGGATYSVYLFQFVFIGLFWKLLLTAGLAYTLPAALCFALLAAAAIGGGMVVSWRVEFPLMDRTRRLLRPAHNAAM